MKLSFNKHHTRGFSLVEILITTLILGVGMVGAAKFQGSIVQSSKLSQQQVEALNIAKALIEPTLHFSTAAQYETFLAMGDGDDDVEGSTDTYNAEWSIDKIDNGRGANVTLSVNWGAGESIYLSTIVSNSTPSFIMQSTHAAPRDPVADPVFVPVTFPAVNPSNPANSENICRCNGGTAVAFNSLRPKYAKHSNFVRVSGDYEGGMMGSWYDSDGDGEDDEESHSYEQPISGATEECNLCCDTANAAAKADFIEQAEKYYAQIEALLMKKVRFGGDQVIGSNGFDPRFLRKGYQTHNLTDDINKFLRKSSGDSWGSWGGDWSSWGDGTDSDDSDSSSYTFTAACGINYDPPPPPTPEQEAANIKPKPIPKSTRCMYYRSH